MRSQEKRIADAVFNTTNFSANSVSSEWNTYSTCDPVGDVKDGIVAFKNQCGMLPDVLIIAFSTFHDLPRCTAIQNLLKYTYPGIDLANMTAPISKKD